MKMNKQLIVRIYVNNYIGVVNIKEDAFDVIFQASNYYQELLNDENEFLEVFNDDKAFIIRKRDIEGIEIFKDEIND